jgi:cAMP-binding proteins - catabolite gene activator and regulatory subunit of cAMP-dependent protein kinases
MKTILENDSEYVCNIQAPCFQKLNPEEVELIRNSKTQVLFRKGENLTKQGAFATYVLFVVSGIAKQHIEGDGTKSYSLRMVTPGEFVGLSSVFTKNTYSYSTVALTDVQAFLIENSSIMKVAKSNGEFAVNIIRRYCLQNSTLFETIHTLMYKQMNGRMAETLLYLNSIKVGELEIFEMLTRKDIAEFAGISTENAVKILKAFEKDGLIALDDKNISLLKADALEEISRLG